MKNAMIIMSIIVVVAVTGFFAVSAKKAFINLQVAQATAIDKALTGQ